MTIGEVARVRCPGATMAIIEAMQSLCREVQEAYPNEVVRLRLLDENEEWQHLPPWPDKRKPPAAVEHAVHEACERRCVLCGEEDPDMLDYGHILDRPMLRDEIPWHWDKRAQWTDSRADELGLGVTLCSNHNQKQRRNPSSIPPQTLYEARDQAWAKPHSAKVLVEYLRKALRGKAARGGTVDMNSVAFAVAMLQKFHSSQEPFHVHNGALFEHWHVDARLGTATPYSGGDCPTCTSEKRRSG